jgi:Holliday junction resolvase
MLKMRYKLRKDELHTQIANQLLEAGFSVADTSRVGGGFPDLAIARNGVCVLVEIKTPRGLKTALERRLKSQVDFARSWKGPLITAYTSTQIIYDFSMLIKRREAYAI